MNWKNVNYYPWEGSHFAHGFRGTKLLVLGESHYGEDEVHNDWTIELTKKYAESGMNHRFWTNIMCTLMGRAREEISASERKDFWNRISFYNYIQFEVDGETKCPDANSWKKSEPMLKEVLEQLQPDKILVLGKRLWNPFDMQGQWTEENQNINFSERVWKIQAKGKDIYCWPINHPSSIGFSWRNWCDKVGDFLKL